jgi:hypothetical protein
MEMVPEEEHFDFEDDLNQKCNNGVIKSKANAKQMMFEVSLRKSKLYYTALLGRKIYIPKQELQTLFTRAFRKHERVLSGPAVSKVILIIRP